ncbi:MAG: TauD/TfdA family dioxygenase [Hyphomicrobiaceae bacterium]
MPLSITPLSPALGAEIVGVDLSKPLPPDNRDRIEDALHQHLVIVLRRQTLNPAELVAGLKQFGQIMRQHRSDILLDDHPEIAVLDSRKAPVEAGEAFPDGSRDWHTDHTNHARPPKVTALYSVTLPHSGGGDTGFANMHAAYDSLPNNVKSELASLKSHNKIENHAHLADADKQRYGTVQAHPVIRTHPITGRKAVYIHPGKAVQLDGMTPEASRSYIDNLLEMIIKPEFIYRHKWQPGDLVLWDNRSLLHIAHRDYDTREGRIMHRVLLEGEIPV